jgi:hypothetical protein
VGKAERHKVVEMSNTGIKRMSHSFVINVISRFRGCGMLFTIQSNDGS